MHEIGQLREIAVDREHFTNQFLTVHRGRKASAHSQSIAGSSAKGDLQIMSLGIMVLVQKQHSAADLADQQIQSTIVAKIACDDTATIAVIVGAIEITQVDE